jgi:Fis family transcriptional regulator, factor for inversion stimulation protein
MKQRFDALVDDLVRGNIFLQEAIEVLEKTMIGRVMTDCAGNQCAAAKQLGIHRNTLQRKMVEYGLGNGRSRARRKPVAKQSRTRRKSGAA